MPGTASALMRLLEPWLQVRLVLTRRSHATGDISDADLQGSGVLCFCPHYPHPRPEKWYIMVTLPNENRVICWKHLVLKDAEIAGLRKFPQEVGVWMDTLVYEMDVCRIK